MVLDVALASYSLHRLVGSCTRVDWDGELRLVNGSNLTEGRLNIYRNEEWGPVCYQDTGESKPDFTNISASVACFQLGFAGAQRWYQRNRFGMETQPVWMKKVNCTGDKTRLEQCNHVWCKTDDLCKYCDDLHLDVGISCTGD